MKTKSAMAVVFAGVLYAPSASAPWVQTNGPYTSGNNIPTITSLTVNGGNIFAGTYGGVFLTADNGANWIAVNSGLKTPYVFALMASGNDIFAATDSGVFRSTNSAASWTAINSGLKNALVSCFTESGGAIFAGADSGVFLSTNNGASWIAIDSGLSAPVYALAVSGNIILAGTKTGVFLSGNNGKSWTAAGAGLPTTKSCYNVKPSGSICQLSPDQARSLAASGAAIFAGMTDVSGIIGAGIFVTADNGASWASADSSLGNVRVSSFAVSGGNILAGTFSNGVYLSTNNGQSWTGVNSGLTNTSVRAMAICNDIVFIGTSLSGVWRRSVSEMQASTNVRPQREVRNQERFAISPRSRAGSLVAITVSLSHSDRVAVKIYDILGKENYSVVNRMLFSGSYRYAWNAATVAPGNYIVEMRNGTHGEFQSILLSR
jgi:hypothetical protein